MPKSVRIAALVAVPLLIVGCSKQAADIAADTPEGTVKAFVAAMKRGDVRAAASAYAYVTEAKAASPDWGDIPPGQQTQILRKTRDAKVEKLKGETAQYKGDAQVGTAQAQGGTASVTVTTGGQAVVLQLVQEDGKWKLTGSQ